MKLSPETIFDSQPTIPAMTTDQGDTAGNPMANGDPGQAALVAWQAEATRIYGPPELRTRKNQRYVQRLARRYSESAVRGMLKALATLDDPMCCANLRDHDLDADPLEDIIGPFDLMGKWVSISKVSDTQFLVDIGEAYDTCGSGGEFLLERLGDGSFSVAEVRRGWIA